jgi:hypothetical protein
MTNQLAEDWVALWQSELTAMAADRELRESWTALVALWAAGAHALLKAPPAAHDFASGTSSAAQPAGSKTATAAPDPGLDEVERLNRRVAELERRLAIFERGGGTAGP